MVAFQGLFRFVRRCGSGPIWAAFNTMGPAQDLDSEVILNLRLFIQMTSNKHSMSVVCFEFDLGIVFWLHFAKLLGTCTGLVQFNAARTCLHCLLFTNKGLACTCLQDDVILLVNSRKLLSIDSMQDISYTLH